MIELRVVSGRLQGEARRIDHYPFTIGRRAGVDWMLAGQGMWDHHATIDIEHTTELVVRPGTGATIRVDGIAGAEIVLRNGCILELGAVRLQCHRSEISPKSDRHVRPLLISGILLLTAFEAFLLWSLK